MPATHHATCEQIKQETYGRMEIIAEAPGAYIPGKNKHVDELVAELRIIAGKRVPGKPLQEEYRDRFAELVTELNIHGISQSELSRITGMKRQNISNYIRPAREKKYYDETRLERPEGKDQLLAELDRIIGRRVSGKIRDEDKERLSEVLTKLHIAHSMTLYALSDRTGMDRNILAGYMHTYIGPDVKPVLPFTPGLSPEKQTWWKKSGKGYKELWRFARNITGISPVKTKHDYRDIAVEAVNYVNADRDVKKALLDFIELDAFTMASASGYKPMAQLPLAFVQWLSEQRGYEITLKDLDRESRDNPGGITKSTGQRFADAVVPARVMTPGGPAVKSPTSQALVKAALVKFFKFMEAEGKTDRYAMAGLRTEMPRKIRAVVYNIPELNEIFNKILIGKPQYYSLFVRLLLQTGSRPGQIFPLRCRDIEEFTTPVKDALGRDFCPLGTLRLYQQEKEARAETVKKKFVPDTVLISAKLRGDLSAWCRSNNLSGNDYIFGKFIIMKKTILFCLTISF